MSDAELLITIIICCKYSRLMPRCPYYELSKHKSNTAIIKEIISMEESKINEHLLNAHLCVKLCGKK